MNRIVCIGGSVANLIAAYHLSETNDVTIIDVHAEIGMPCGQPGYLYHLDKLQPYMTKEPTRISSPSSK
jgi:flavin-dependent dehydrogenase